MAFSRRKDADKESKRARLGRGSSRDPFEHLSEERAKAEEEVPWFLAPEEGSDFAVQAGVSSNLRQEDLADTAPETAGLFDDPSDQPQPGAPADAAPGIFDTPPADAGPGIFDTPPADAAPGHFDAAPGIFDTPPADAAPGHFDAAPGIFDTPPPGPGAPHPYPSSGHFDDIEPAREGQVDSTSSAAHLGFDPPRGPDSDHFVAPSEPGPASTTPFGDTPVDAGAFSPPTAEASALQSSDGFQPQPFGQTEAEASNAYSHDWGSDIGGQPPAPEGPESYPSPETSEFSSGPTSPPAPSTDDFATPDQQSWESGGPGAEPSSGWDEQEAQSPTPAPASGAQPALEQALVQSFRDLVAQAPVQRDVAEDLDPPEDIPKHRAEPRRPRKPPTKPRRF